MITTPEGHILINSGLESSVPMIEASITKLGFLRMAADRRAFPLQRATSRK